MRIHFIGIGGVGVSGLAEVALSQGHQVSGSDRSASAITHRLSEHGAHVRIGHAAEAIAHVRPDLVVYSAAIPPTNPELKAAMDAGIPTMTRSAFLGRAMDDAQPPRVAVAGTHGKTTTTSMIGTALAAAGMDPTVLIGGDYTPFGGNVRIGRGPFVTEACEAFRSFLDLHPDVAVVTNVEEDHLDCYGDFEHVLAAFIEFVAGIRDGGTLVLWGEDPSADLVSEQARARGLKVLRYGMGGTAAWDLQAVEIGDSGSQVVEVWIHGAGRSSHSVGSLTLATPGRHNVLNALAALGAAMACGASPDAALRGLQGFGGVERRFEVLGTYKGATVVDDYAHHPTEIRATIAAARTAFPGRRIVVVFQPHLYSRTRDLLDEFASALAMADAVTVTGIYAAREEPIPGVDAALLADRVAAASGGASVLTEPEKDRLPGMLQDVVHHGDVLLMLGAGDIRDVSVRLVQLDQPDGKGA